MSANQSQPLVAGEAAVQLPVLIADGRHARDAKTGMIIFAGQIEEKSYVSACEQVAHWVRACNSHGALVAALEFAVHEMESAESYIEARWGGKENAYAEALHAALVQARAALNSVKGVQS